MDPNFIDVRNLHDSNMLEFRRAFCHDQEKLLLTYDFMPSYHINYRIGIFSLISN